MTFYTSVLIAVLCLNLKLYIMQEPAKEELQLQHCRPSPSHALLPENFRADRCWLQSCLANFYSNPSKQCYLTTVYQALWNTTCIPVVLPHYQIRFRIYSPDWAIVGWKYSTQWTTFLLHVAQWPHVLCTQRIQHVPKQKQRRRSNSSFVKILIL